VRLRLLEIHRSRDCQLGNHRSVPKMETLKIRFLEDYAGQKSGDICDVNKNVARAYIELGKAKEINDVEVAVAAALASESAKFDAKLARTLDDIKAALKPSTSDGPPSRGLSFDAAGNATDKGVETSRVDNGEASADRGGEKCFGEILNLIYRQKIATETSERDYCSARLERSYGLSRTKFDAEGAVKRAGTESVSGGSNLGYLVKPQFVDSLFQFGIEDSVVEPNAFQVPIGQAIEIKWPALDQYFTSTGTGNSSAYGGVLVTRKGETTQRQTSDAKLREIDFKITDLTGLSPLSRDLIMDNFIAADAIIQRLFARAIAHKKDWEFIQGNGVGKPLGYLNAPALLTVTRDTSAHIKIEDLLAMIAAMHQGSWGNAMWVAHQSTLPDLSIITDHSGARAFQPNSSVTQAMMLAIMAQSNSKLTDMKFKAAGTLLGMPIRFTEKVPALGTTGCLSLIDPEQYGVATRMGLEVGISEHFYFDTDQIAFRFKVRNDGQPLWLGPYKDMTGASYSPFVQLSQ
jgi:HK97 family phage major capsid protein